MTIMENSKYNSIVEDFRQLRQTIKAVDIQDVLDALFEKYSKEGYEEKLILSLIMYVHQSDTRAKVGKVDWAKAYDDYKNGKGTILEIAKELDISPTIVAKRFLLNISDKLTVKQWLQDTNEIPNGELAVQVMMAQYADPIFGQLSHCVMRNAGELFEYEVAQILKKAQISYASENSLRTKEFDVTPDFKLNIPIEIVLSSDNTKAYILPPVKLPLCQLCSTDEFSRSRIFISWIECKALFASGHCHKDYLKYQFNSYANRFGRGLILYKYGCTRSVMKRDPKLIIAEELVYHECANQLANLRL
ncbi:uncharacterized protein C15orf41 homolog isoform X2 [Tetranychus urticae]|nr:uncharacterized protein C15orf41 homolog isoform X2 [Tetranychus urticae]